MVEYADIQQFPSLNDRTCHVDIFRAFSRISRGMIVRQHDGIGIFADHQLKNLADPYSGGVLGALI